LRSDSHAQREIRDYANAMYELVKPNFPLCCEAFEDYVQGSTTFSKQEMEVIRELLSYTDAKAALAGMSVKDVGVLESKLGKRESKEFLEKLKQGDAE
jgi:thymidylate synthase (FAD)